METLPGMYPRIKPQRRPKNPVEAQFFDFAESEGWIITKKGWPDYACFLPDGDFVVVEVKPLRSSRLKAWQWKVMQYLTAAGVDCYRWSPDTGFTKIILPTKHI